MNRISSPIILVLTAVAGGVFIFNFAFGTHDKPKWNNTVLDRCVLENITYFYMQVSNATECDGIVKWHDTHNWKMVKEFDGEVIITFENNMTAKEKALEEGKIENK